MTVTVTIKGQPTEVPDTAWVGWHEGKVTGWYATKQDGDRAIGRRDIDSASPADDLARNQAAYRARKAHEALPPLVQAALDANRDMITAGDAYDAAKAKAAQIRLTRRELDVFVGILAAQDDGPIAGDAGPAPVKPWTTADSIADIERVGREYPDGIHTCAELQQLEPGRRHCTCGRCPTGQVTA